MSFILECKEDKYILSKKIGEGSTCKCYECKNMNQETSENSKTYAIKIFPEKNYLYYSNEVSILEKLTNPDFFLPLYNYGQGYIYPYENGKFDENNKELIFYQISEYATGGELSNYFDIQNGLSETISAFLFTKIVKAIQCLHENNIAHCDIKPQNIVLTKDYMPKLIDFGFSQEFGSDLLLHCDKGTPLYSAPETKNAYIKGYNGVKGDIFSLGVLLFVFTVGDLPFESATNSDKYYKHIIRNNFGRYWECFKMYNFSDEFKDLINNLICVKPEKRLSIAEILSHPWIKKNCDSSCSKLDKESDDYLEIITQLSKRKKEIK